MLRHSHDMLWFLNLEQDPYGPCEVANGAKVNASEVGQTKPFSWGSIVLFVLLEKREEMGDLRLTFWLEFKFHSLSSFCQTEGENDCRIAAGF